MFDAETGLELIEFQEHQIEIPGTTVFVSEYYGYGEYKNRPVICQVRRIDDGAQCVILAYVDDKDYFLYKLNGGSIGELFTKVYRYINADDVITANFWWPDLLGISVTTYPAVTS